VNRADARAALLRQWWLLGLALLAPLPLLVWLAEAPRVSEEQLPMAVFLLGLASLFPTLRAFRHYKRALFSVARERDGAGEAEAWAQLARVWRRALLVAGLPAWLAVVGLFCGLESVPLILLWASSALLLWLYRLPRQLC